MANTEDESRRRCDLCGPYTPEEAAALVLGRWKPQMTGHLCAECTVLVREGANALSKRIDEDIARRVSAEVLAERLDDRILGRKSNT